VNHIRLFCRVYGRYTMRDGPTRQISPNTLSMPMVFYTNRPLDICILQVGGTRIRTARCMQYRANVRKTMHMAVTKTSPWHVSYR